MSAKTTKMLLIRAMLKLVRAQKFSAITIDDICEKAGVSRRTFYRYYSDKHALLKDVFVECFFSKISADEDRDFFLETDIYRELSLMEEWIREGMKITPAEFASALRSSYIIYATWITEVATGKPASDFPQEMLEPIKFIKK